MLREFNRDRYCFLKYYATSFLLFAALDAALIAFWAPTSWAVGFQWWPLSLAPVGIFLGVQSAVFIHNAAHQNIGPRWLNRICGELCALHQLYGYVGWQVPHLLHHQYPDDPRRDPHPPGSLTFWQFFLGMRTSLRQCLKSAYLDRWADFSDSDRVWAVTTVFARLSMYLRLAFWLLLLGPVVFVAFYLPSYVANVLFFAHFNYYTHRPDEDGEGEILNLDHNLCYKIVNRVFFGVFFHRNHHLKPSVFNPMHVCDSGLTSTRSSQHDLLQPTS